MGSCCCPAAALKISRLGTAATLAGRAFHWKEGIFIVVLANMNLTECHRMSIPGDPMCGLHIVMKGRGHQAIYNFIEEAETCHSLSGLFTKGSPGCMSLDHFNLMGLIFGMEVPNC